MHNIGSINGQGTKRNLSIDFKSDLALSKQVGSVTIECENLDLADKIESAIKRCVKAYRTKTNL